MTTLTKSAVRIALVLALLAFGIVESTAAASQHASAAGTQTTGTVTTIAQADNANGVGPGTHGIAVLRKGSPAIVFTDDSAIALQLKSTRAEIKSLEAALAKDLARGDFRACETGRIAAASSRRSARGATSSPAAQLLAARGELSALKQAFRTDLANGDFYAPQTSRELRQHHAGPMGDGEMALAKGAVSVSDDVWSLKMAIERDLHAKTFRAIETHFNIDGRRWKVARF